MLLSYLFLSSRPSPSRRISHGRTTLIQVHLPSFSLRKTIKSRLTLAASIYSAHEHCERSDTSPLDLSTVFTLYSSTAFPPPSPLRTRLSQWKPPWHSFSILLRYYVTAHLIRTTTNQHARPLPCRSRQNLIAVPLTAGKQTAAGWM